MVTRAQVLLTKKSYEVVVTDNLQKQIEHEFQYTMLLMNTKVHKKAGLDDEADGKLRTKEQINMDKNIYEASRPSDGIKFEVKGVNNKDKELDDIKLTKGGSGISHSDDQLELSSRRYGLTTNKGVGSKATTGKKPANLESRCQKIAGRCRLLPMFQNVSHSIVMRDSRVESCTLMEWLNRQSGSRVLQDVQMENGDISYTTNDKKEAEKFLLKACKAAKLEFTEESYAVVCCGYHKVAKTQLDMNTGHNPKK